MEPVSTSNATKLPIEPEEKQSIAVEAGKERFWINRGDGTLELLAIKTREKYDRDI